jgi:hypothetical protein
METSMTRRTVVAAIAGLLVLGTRAWADEGKDESGKGKREHKSRHREGGSSRDFHGYSRIPNGHLPPPGECRIWYPDRPAGRQPPPFKCDDRRGRVEPGGWLIAPGPQPQEVRVDVYDPRRPGIVIDVGIFDARTGAMVRIVGAK